LTNVVEQIGLARRANYPSFAPQRGIAMGSPGWPSIARARGARLGTLSVLLACGLLLAMVQPAAAQPLERSHEHIVETFEDVVCDIPVTITLDIIENIHVRLAKSGFPLFQSSPPAQARSPSPTQRPANRLSCASPVPSRT
jgi:hypothetical protein